MSRLHSTGSERPGGVLEDNFWAYSNFTLGPTPGSYVMPRERTAELLGEVTSRVPTGLQQISFSTSSEPARGIAGRLFHRSTFGAVEGPWQLTIRTRAPARPASG